MTLKTISIQRLAICLLLNLTMMTAWSQSSIELRFLGRYSTNTYDAGGTEITAYDAASKRLFSVNGSTGNVDIINFTNPASPVLISSFSLAPYGISANSVAAKNGIIAIAVEAVVKQDSGKVVFIDAFGNFLNQVTAGALPDMITFTPDGNYVLVANEGEPNSAYTVDPEGSVTIINISGGVASATTSFARFDGFNSAAIDSNIRIFGPGSSVAQDLEPEYITVSANSQTAWVTCQENNAWAIIDIPTATVTTLKSMGFKNHNLPGQGLDASDQNGGVVNIANWPIKGMYMPDAISSYVVGGQTYIISANEGDVREYAGLNEALRLSSSSYKLDSIVFPNYASLKNNNNLGRLNVSTKSGDHNGDGFFEEIYAFGGRSFSIWNANGDLVWDSGDQIEQIANTLSAANFNCSNTNNTKKNRSDDKGPEPEAATVATIGDSIYAFIGLERIGGIMVFNVTTPTSPYFVQYLNTRNFTQTPGLNLGADLGPEGVLYIPKSESPNGRDLIVVANEISGTISIFEIGVRTQIQILHASDFEASVDAIQDAPRFAAIVDTLEHTYPNTFILSSGDNMIPSPFSSSGEDPSLVTPYKNTYISYYGSNFANNDLRAGIGRADISIMNFIGIEAAALGNHEFDWGTSELRNIIAGVNSGSNIRWFGAQFPYLSANLNFSLDGNLSNIFTSSRLSNTAFRSNPSMSASQIAATPKLAPSAVIIKNGEKFGVVGATTPILASISSPGATSIKNPGAGTNDMSLLATILQPVIDSLRFAEGCNKIILLAHMQQLFLEKQLATHLKGVDIIISGGSHTLMADATDRLRAGDVAVETYPFFTTDSDGLPVAIVNTDANYKYVGRLVIDFTPAGVIIPSSVNAAISGAYAADSLGVEENWGAGNYSAAFTAGSKGTLVKTLCDAIGNVISSKDGNIFGKTSVFLEGRRTFVRTEETNLGNLSADANLWMAKKYDPSVSVSLKNGGGIRSVIGYVNSVGSNVSLEPPLANPTAGKLQGDISQLDIENSLRFNNQLSLVTLNANGLRAILEHGVRATTPGATPGQFPQIGGVRFSYDPTRPQLSRIISAVIIDSTGQTIDTLVSNGQVYGDTSRTFRVVTLNFLAGGGDGYPFVALGTSRVDLPTLPAAGPGLASFAIPGSEQDAFAEYMKSNYSTSPYSIADTPGSLDTRIEDVQQRTDDILPLSIASLTNTSGVCDTVGTISVAYFGGSGPYQINWAGDSAITSASSYSISNLPFGTIVITVTDAFGQTATDSITISPSPQPDPAGPITGTSQGCTVGGPGARLYYIAPVNNAINYVWSWNGTSGVSFLSGNGTPSVTLQWTSPAIQAGVVGTLTVTPLNQCGQAGPPQQINLEFYSASPVTPGSISGPAKICPGDTIVYSVAAVNRAKSYMWTLPAGMNIVNGVNTNIIQVAVVSGYTGGTLSVRASNICGMSPVRSKSISQNLPARPIAITGPATGICNATGLVYSTSSVTPGVIYSWTAPFGTTLVSGQGTNSITVDVTSPSFISGQIIVQAQNSCGGSSNRALNISAKPARPIAVNGPLTLCPSQLGVAYSVATVSGADAYNWTVPAGAIITSGQGTKNILVDFGAFFVSGQTISVNTSNSCGSSINRQSAGIFIDTTGCSGSLLKTIDSVEPTLVVYPNPANVEVNISIQSATAENIIMDMIDLTGKTIATQTLSLQQKVNTFRINTSEYAEGLYFIRLMGNSINESIRITVRH
jgi:2',3'-cyclic-nucleotide 2'-phosphodiesterase / 3'-nucleotidase / 5'-nucleotidase